MLPNRRERSNDRRSTVQPIRGWPVGLLTACAAFVLLTSAGCGTNAEAVFAQSGSSAAFTLLDIFLTDTANAMLDQRQPPPGGGGGDEDGDGDEDGGDGGDGDGGGAVSPGEQAYADAGCANCHGQNAEGGSGPALFGMDELAALEDRFADGASHLGATLTDQEIADVADWLLGEDTTDGGADGDAGGSAAAGEQAYADAGCAACHGGAAEGGGGPALAGVDELAALEDRFSGGAAHLGTTLTDQEIADVAAWLAGL